MSFFSNLSYFSNLPYFSKLSYFSNLSDSSNLSHFYYMFGLSVSSDFSNYPTFVQLLWLFLLVWLYNLYDFSDLNKTGIFHKESTFVKMKRKFVDMLNIGMHLPNNKHRQNYTIDAFVLINIFFRFAPFGYLYFHYFCVFM